MQQNKQATARLHKNCTRKDIAACPRTRAAKRLRHKATEYVLSFISRTSCIKLVSDSNPRIYSVSFWPCAHAANAGR